MIPKLQSFGKELKTALPGLFLAAVIAAAAKWIEELLPAGIISASVIALFIGMIINTIGKPSAVYQPGIRFTSKKLLKFAIILLGAGLNISVVLQVGGMSLIVMLFTLATCFGIGHYTGKALGLNWKMSNLISAGTGICGGSAIAAIAPVIEADDTDIAFAMSATFLFDMVMILLFPAMGHALNLTDTAYGLWSGTAVNDTSSVVAAGYGFSEAAGAFAVMVKLTRTLSIIPTVLIFGFINARKNAAISRQATGAKRMNIGATIRKSVPLFIAFFLLMSGLKSIGLIPDGVSDVLKQISKFLMVAALAAIGLNTDLGTMKKNGARPMLHGFIISALVVIVALGAIWLESLLGITPMTKSAEAEQNPDPEVVEPAPTPENTGSALEGFIVTL